MAALDGLDTGRFGVVGDVEVEDIPGLMDSGNFRIFTPDKVDAPMIAGMDAGRFADVGPVVAVPTPDVERAQADVGDVFTQPVSGLFGSDIYGGAPDVRPMPIDGLESSAARGAPGAPGGKKRAADGELEKITCRRCGEIHRWARCPACGEPHP